MRKKISCQNVKYFFISTPNNMEQHENVGLTPPSGHCQFAFNKEKIGWEGVRPRYAPVLNIPGSKNSKFLLM
jgi:hypothetical protein